MKIIGRKTHGCLDYLVGGILIASPWLFSFYGGGMESWIPITLGAGAVFYSLVTDYELGVAGIIPMRIHLIIDMLSGVLLAVSPWLFGFADLVFWPHLVIGIIEIVVPILTNPGSQYMGKASPLGRP